MPSHGPATKLYSVRTAIGWEKARIEPCPAKQSDHVARVEQQHP